MERILKGFFQFLIANFVVIISIIMLPVFLITDDFTFFDQIMDSLFNHRS